MAIKCKNGHWYDPNVYRSCPHCKRNNEKLSLMLDNVEEDDKTISIADVDISLGQQLGEIVGESVSNAASLDMLGGMSTGDDDDKTISFGFFSVTGLQPVTGWLVCLNGGEKGKDYRLHSGKNFVGRSNTMDVILIDDKSVSRDKHCTVTYDPKGNEFYLSPENGNTVYLNGEMMETAKKIKADDVITIGKTDLIFISYCKEDRTWEEK